MTRDEAVKNLNKAKDDLAIFKEQIPRSRVLSNQDNSAKVKELEDAVAAAQKEVDGSSVGAGKPTAFGEE